VEVTAQWDDRTDDDKYLPWVPKTHEALKPFISPNAYTNLSSDQGAAWLRGAYGTLDKWERIVRLKQEWDPENRFSYNKNIARAVESFSPVRAGQ
jgi:FAD/FMN-containing dehydrogenase